MQEPNQNKTRVKMMKSSALLHNVKHTQKATCSAKLSCSSPSQEKSDFKSFFPPPKKRGKLWSETFQRVILTKKGSISSDSFCNLISHMYWKVKRKKLSTLLKQPDYWCCSEGPPPSKGQYKWYHRKLCPSGKWCSSLKRIFVLKKISKIWSSLSWWTVALKMPTWFVGSQWSSGMEQRYTKTNVWKTILEIRSRGCS